MNHLIEHLLQLNDSFDKEGVPLILGGGMGLYLRNTYGRVEESKRYPFTIEARATEDLDIFLQAETIVSEESIEKVKNILSNHEYIVNPDAKYFQFQKEIQLAGTQKNIRIDFLAAPPATDDLNKVKISKPRIKPKKTENFHAYQTDEAEGLSLGIEEINIQEKTIKIISSFNYIILKLHAFKDRKDKKDNKSDQGRHHAWDIFATIVKMTPQDWANVKVHNLEHKDKSYLISAKEIQKEFFNHKDAIGFLRMREYGAYQKDRSQFDDHLEKVVQDLTDVFSN